VARDLSYAINKMNNKKQMRLMWKEMKKAVKKREKKVWKTGKLRHYGLDNKKIISIVKSPLNFLYNGFNGKEEIKKFEEQGYSLRSLDDLVKWNWKKRKAEEAKYVALDALLVGTPLCEDVIGVIMAYL
jgi:hypothetical protein